MFNVSASDAIGMVVAAVVLISLSIWSQGFRKRSRDLIGSRNIFFALSGVLLVISVGSMLFKGFNLGMDFAGGTLVEVGFTDSATNITAESVRTAIKAYSDANKLGFQDAQVQVEEKSLTAANEPFRRVIIRVGRTDQKSLTTPEIEGMAGYLDKNLGRLYRQTGKSLNLPPTETPSGAPSAGASGAPKATASAAPAAASSGAPTATSSGAPTAASSGAPTAASSGAPAATAENAHEMTPATQAATNMSNAILSRETIDPIIGRELWTNSLFALVVALVLQLLYITLRFGNQVRYGLAADIALVHDVVIMAGLYSLTSRQVDSPFLAALLTVIGYSVMDSIVVFDRIRENVYLSRKGNYTDICNASVNQTMSRSVNTTLTVLLTLFALFFFGGDTLRNFAFALLCGITCGAYSSIFIATPLVVIFDNWVKKKEEERVSERRRLREQADVDTGSTSASEEGGLRRRATDATSSSDEPDDGDDDAARRPGAAARRRNKARRRR